MGDVVNVKDKSSKLAVKDAILMRSGFYTYTRDEVLAWGITPKEDKPLYKVYRPAGVVVAAKDMLNMVPVTKEHPPTDVDSSNFSTFASGVAGGPIEAVSLEDGEIALKGQIAFFTRDAFDHYSAGNRETSVGFEKLMYAANDSSKAGYDFIVKEIKSVNHIAVVSNGRGGSSVRVMDSAAVENNVGGMNMKRGILQRLGIVKTTDENFKFSTVVLDSVKKVHSLDTNGLEKEIAGVMSHISTLGDSETKEVLVGMVTDCFKNPVEVIAAQDKVAVKLDELYVACKDADAEVVQKILDAASKKEEKKDNEEEKEDGKEEKKADVKDSVDIEEIVKRAVSAVVTDSISSKVDEAVNKALGLDNKDKKEIKGQEVSALDSVAVNEDASYLVRGCFGV